MKTPDGREFDARAAAGPVAGGVLVAARFAAGLVLGTARGIGKVIATVWRIAGALDAALWRGVKLAFQTFFGAFAIMGRVSAEAGRDFVAWLPTRSGRAYSAVSGVVLIIAGLWIVDELRVGPAAVTATGERRPPLDDDDPILARIEGRYVHLSEVEAAARASGALRDGERLTARSAFTRRLVEAHVEQRLLARAAQEAGVARDPDVARRLAAARNRILASAYMETRLEEAVTDEQVRRLYDAQAGVTRLGDEVRARHILVATGEEAAEIEALLDGGADFETLAAERSLDRATAPLGGDIGYFTRDMMAPALGAAAFTTAAGERAPPFQSEFGWHVLEVTDRRSTEGVPLASVEDNIRRFLTLRTIERTLEELKEGGGVVYYQSEGGRRAPASEDERAAPGGLRN